jgi:triacylglycerol lipase
MKKSTLASMLFIGSLLASSWVAAATSSYQVCNTSGGVASCSAGAGTGTITSDYAKTKYPIVLAHGMGGFSETSGLDYWYGIPTDLSANGAQVFVTTESAFNSSEIRGEQLLTQVNQILAITGSDKVNLIGHSHGAQSVRYVAGVIPTHVSSVTSIGGSNKGSPVADFVYNIVSAPVVGSVLSPLVSQSINFYFQWSGIASGHQYDQDSLAGLNSLTTAGAAAFNVNFPDGIPTTTCGEGAYTAHGINYYSWVGNSLVTNIFDPSDLMLLGTGMLIPGESDGLAPKCGSHLGQVIRDNYNMNHLDEVNQVAGLVNIFEVSPVTLFRDHANRLKVAGF